MNTHENNKFTLANFRNAQYHWDETEIKRCLSTLCAPDAIFRLSYPFGDMHGPDAFYDQSLAILKAAWPDLERRDWIVMAGDWVMVDILDMYHQLGVDVFSRFREFSKARNMGSI